MKRIAVLTSGGDAPGMNAAIRAVVRIGISQDCEVFGVRRGYAGLLSGDLFRMDARSVGGIIQLGGTTLGSARCPEFKETDNQKLAIGLLRERGVEGLVVIGGNGSQAGANALSSHGFPVVGVASTIDNDLFGSDVTIGFDTALNIALEAIDRLKVTASSHQRAFLVEVMGRDCGSLALMAGLAGGAECVVIPEREIHPEEVARILRAAYDRGKAHAIAVVSEGAHNNADELATYFTEHRARIGFAVRATCLGHVQRGGSPGSFDRLLATRLAARATQMLVEGTHGVLAGWIRGRVASTPLADVVRSKKEIDWSLYELAEVLAM